MTQEEFNQLMKSKEEVKVILYTDSSAVGLCYKFDTFGELVDLIKNQDKQKPNYCHHEVDLSSCSEEYRKAYYDGWNNCNMQHSQCELEKSDVLKCLINGMKFYYENNEEATWGTLKFSMKVKDILDWLEKQKDCIKLPNSAYTSNKDVIEFADKYSHAVWENLMDKFKKIENYSIGCNDVSDIVLNAIINTYNWVKKQTEQDILEDAILDGYILDGNEDGLIAKTIRYKHEKQGGQKPTWSKENGVKDNWEYIQDFIGKLGHFPKDSDELDVLINYVLNEKQRSAKWSEKDRSKVQRICKYLNEAKKYYADITEVRECMDWLKSLQNKVQPKQEWNKEDSIRLQRIIDFLWYNRKGDTDTIYQQEQDIDWLKSLRPQNKWKPSDEQMDSITCAVKKMKESACYDSELVSLLNDLKKLKEE